MNFVSILLKKLREFRHIEFLGKFHQLSKIYFFFLYMGLNLFSPDCYLSDSEITDPVLKINLSVGPADAYHDQNTQDM